PLTADDTLVVANYPPPANHFHALRRQIKRSVRKPLVVMTPKSLLRHPQAVATVEELAEGRYQPFIPAETDPAGARRLVLCSGKVYYDALKAREALDRLAEVAIARVEQLYPFPEAAVRAELERFSGAEVVWRQGEPANMGARSFVRPRLDDLLMGLHGDCNRRVRYAGRVAAASPATGSAAVHTAEQEAILRAALGLGDEPEVEQ